MDSLPSELILYILQFDDNEYYKKQYNKCLTELTQTKYKLMIVNYLKPLQVSYDWYCYHYIPYLNLNMTRIENCSKYILTMIKIANNAERTFMNNEYYNTIKPSLIYKKILNN